jgi:S-(hydroxymethyl)glutathione dehydrogenase/alcohol dehydrogenase
MRIRAAVLEAPGAPVEIVDVDLAPPRRGEVLVRIAASGVCASDLHVVDGDLPEPLPIVLGHEAAGVVEEVGEDVERVAPGEHVVLSIIPACGACSECARGRPNLCAEVSRMAASGTLADGTSRLSADGRTLHHFNAVSSFAEYAVVPEAGAVPIRRDVPLDAAALLSCSVLTGYGAVVNTARVETGASVAVWGCGGVGLNVVQAARLAGARPVVAVDVRREKLALAERVGATAVVDARAGNAVDQVRATVPDGVDYAFEALGTEPTIQQAWEATRAGGTLVVVGIVPRGRTIAIDPWHFVYEKTIKGCYLGSARIDVDVPRLVDLYAAGELHLDDIISRRIPLAELPAAFERLRAGDVARQVVVFD